MKRSPIRRSDPATVQAWQRRSARRWRTRRSRTAEQADLWRDVVAGCMVRARGACEAPSVGAPGPCDGPLDGHHVLPRSKGGRDTISNTRIVCRRHHEWIHRNPRRAHALGLLEGSVS